MPDERYTAPAPHNRTLPHVPVNEQGMRELEEWLTDKIRRLVRAGTRAAASGWRFNFLNGVPTETDKGYGYLQFTEAVDMSETPDPLAAGGSWGGVVVDTSGEGLLIGSDTNATGVLIKGRQSPVGLLADGADMDLSVNGSDGHLRTLLEGDTWSVVDHLGSPIVTWTG